MGLGKRSILGACGEHYVASYLSGHGLIATLTKPGTAAIDMHVRLRRGGRTISLQVKTGGTKYNHVAYKRSPENNYWVWQTGRKAMKTASRSHWFAYLIMDGWPLKEGTSMPTIYFVPSLAVAKVLQANPKSQPDWFWMYETDAKKYAGLLGFQKFKKALRK